VLANRLSENPNTRVLLLEAGGWDSDPLIHIPLGWGRMLAERRHDWMYDSAPEPGLDGRSVDCARGKVIGGSSSINAMLYVRGHRTDFDRWADRGARGWDYASVLPYFRRQETWEGGESDYRGGEGPLLTRASRYEDPLVEAYDEAIAMAGHGRTADYNGAEQEGFCRKQFTIGHGRRCSAAAAYLRPALARRNLTVLTRARATRVIFSGRRAVGIAYQRGGVQAQALAEAEVLLAGGVINTPQLLLLSGIGAPEELRAHSLPIVAASPGVGKNLQDHLSVVVACARKLPGPFHAQMRADRAAVGMAQALMFGRGFATDIPAGSVGFVRTRSDAAAPDIEIMFSAAPLTSAPYLEPLISAYADGFGCRVVMLRPESAGQVKLASADPLAAPDIGFNFLATDRDKASMRAGVALCREIFRQKAMAPFIAKELVPGDAVADAGALDSFVRRTAITVHHPLGTCRMGADNDAVAVVDPYLCVRGVDGLRVIDASVMPDMIGGNINAAVIMIAERAADLIRQRGQGVEALAACAQ